MGSLADECAPLRKGLEYVMLSGVHLGFIGQVPSRHNKGCREHHRASSSSLATCQLRCGVVSREGEFSCLGAELERIPIRDSAIADCRPLGFVCLL